MTVQREWLEKDYYEVLGVAPDAGEKDIKRAYRRLARQYHPDANPGDPQAEDRFKAISAAYDVLGDPADRARYDEVRSALRGGWSGAGGFDPPGFPGFDGSGFDGPAFGFGDLFGDLFARAREGGRPRAAAGRDLQTELQLDFSDAVFGHTTELTVSSRVPCATCAGTGAKQSCADCGGSGARAVPRRVNVRVPAGVADGQVLRLPGRGETGSNGGPPGDLYVRVQVAPHPLFGRAGRNLTLTVPVTYPEAALGAEIKLPTLGGAPVTVRIPPGTPSGRVLRVPGHGVPRQDGTRGDLLLTIEVSVPARMSGKERKAVESLARAMNGHSNPREHLGV
jgi:molecular chaperone DnaJ